MSWLQSVLVPVMIGVASSLAASLFADRSNARQFRREREAVMLAALVRWCELAEMQNARAENPEFRGPTTAAMETAEAALMPFLHELPAAMVQALHYDNPYADVDDHVRHYDTFIAAGRSFVADRST